LGVGCRRRLVGVDWRVGSLLLVGVVLRSGGCTTALSLGSGGLRLGLLVGGALRSQPCRVGISLRLSLGLLRRLAAACGEESEGGECGGENAVSESVHLKFSFGVE
jgi:hypothetical protein